MKKERLYVISLLFAILTITTERIDGKKVIIHVPYRVKNVKHTHTIYKVIPHHHEKKKDDYAQEQDSEEFDHYK